MTSSELPRWQATLLAIPANQRTRSQRDLVRGLELAQIVRAEMRTPVEPDPNDPRAMRIILAGLEAELLCPFRQSALFLGDMEFSQKYNDFTNELYIKSKKFFLGQTENESLSTMEVLAAAATHIQFGPYFVPANQQQVDFVDYIAEDFKHMTGSPIWKSIQKNLDNEPWAADTALDAKTIKEALRLANAIYLLNASADLKYVEYAVNEVIPSACEDQDPSAHTALRLGKLWRVIGCPFRQTDSPSYIPWGIQRGSRAMERLTRMLLTANKAVLGLLERVTAAAEAEGDDFCFGIVGSYLAFLLTDDSFTFNTAGRISDLVRRVEAAAARCRPWLPRVYREQMTLDHVKEALRGLPDNKQIISRMFRFMAGARLDSLVESALPEVEPTFNAKINSCGLCGAHSQNLMVCSGCFSTHYCNSAHQKAHWKAGHKNECAALRAAKEEKEKAAAAVEEEKKTAAPPARGAPAPAGGRVNNKKKKKGGKK